MRKLLVNLFCIMALTTACGISAASLEGVTLPDSATVGGQNLILNGTALRTKTWFKVKVYVGGLYLTQKADTVQAVMAESGSDRVLMHMIYAASKGQFADAWDDGFNDNNSNIDQTLNADIKKFETFFGDSKKDDVITIDYIPGQGTEVRWNGNLKGIIEGEDFHKALLNAFLGPKLPDDFRNGLLGKSN